MAWQEISAAGGLSVITGGASGVGFAAAEHLATCGFDLMLVDSNAAALEQAAHTLRKTGATVHVDTTDVSDATAMEKLAERAFGLGDVTVLMNNAGIGGSSATWSEPDAWRQIFNVNFFGILNGVQSFVPRLIEAGKPAVVVNTGSKQGITTPPGNPAYNASKAAVRVLTEQLAHELREADAPIDVHLFVPGFTYTGMIARAFSDKPQGAWTSAEAIAYLFDAMARGDFYVLCPDNMVTPEIDARRVLWSAGDIAENRPPLSRWHPDFKDAFEAFEKGG